VNEWGEKVMVPEWEEDSGYRDKLLVERMGIDVVSSLTGYSMSFFSQCLLTGKDLVRDASPVRVSEYCVAYGNSDNALPGFSRGGVGPFSPELPHLHRAESHRGFCHGGSMTSVLDDVIGWCAFMTTGECKRGRDLPCKSIPA
jgi:hypothetical protein